MSAVTASPTPQQRQRTVTRMPSAKEIVTAANLHSPLTQLRVGMEQAQARPIIPIQASYPPHPTAEPRNEGGSRVAPVPPLDFNLFRTSSIYSVDSVSSLQTVTSDHRPESPTTPKGSAQFAESYFEQKQTHLTGGSITDSAQDSSLTPPKRSFVVRSRPQTQPQLQLPLGQSQSHRHPQTRTTPPAASSSRLRTAASTPLSTQAPSPFPYESSSLPSTSSRPKASTSQRSRSGSHPTPTLLPTPSAIHPVPLPESTGVAPDRQSVHGEQGSEWGEDEKQFEWLDSGAEVPQASNGAAGAGRLGLRMSPSKRLEKLKAAVVAPLTGGGAGAQGEGRKLRRQLTFARKAPPPPPATDLAKSPRKEKESATAARPSASSPSKEACKASDVPVPKSSSRSPLQPSSFQPSALGPSRPSGPSRSNSTPGPRQAYTPRDPFHGYHNRKAQARPAGLRVPPTTLVPLKSSDSLPRSGSGSGSGSQPLAAPASRRSSHLSFQSVAYSFYDLDGDLPTPSAGSSPSELAFPKGRYTRVKLSSVDHTLRVREARARKESGESTTSTGSSGTIGPGTAEECVTRGLEAKASGDLAKAAWWFMRATEGGSTTGRMYYGISLRHGWGIAKDPNTGFGILSSACRDSLTQMQAEGSTLEQKRQRARDVGLGLFELANCHLDGCGTKKDPEVALGYLRQAANMGDLASQEQLGFLLSKGGTGYKKDMKEAAKWYRMAIDQGSTNTFGLAWVWKDKYMV